MQQNLTRRAQLLHAFQTLEFIRAFFTWFFMLLARLAEPLLMLSVIYVIVEQAVKPLHSQAIEYTAIAIMVSAPEVMIAGSFKIAAVAKAQGQRLATLLYITCWLFIVLLLVTVADVLIFHLSGIGLELLMFFRCAVAVGYSIIMRVMPHQEEGSEQASDLTKKFSEQLTHQVESAERRLSELTQKFSSELTHLINQAQSERVEMASISETTEAHSIALAALPTLIERQSLTMKQAVQELRASLETGLVTRPKLSLVNAEVTNKEFIEDYFTTHPDARNVDVIAEATKHGLNISPSYVSQIRKAFTATKEQAS